MQSNATHISEYESDELPPGHSLLYGQYQIECHLIDGGFGMTYLARDSLDRKVVVKECFPSTICRRISGEVRPRKPSYQERFQSVIRSFLKEALRMAKLDHPNIVKVHQVFQENNTAYIAMDYVDGMDLLSMLDIDPGRLTEGLIADLLDETLNALDYVHGLGMLHRDISPDNLLLDADDGLTLIDFGAAREEAARQTRALSVVMSVKDGYSPHEFYYTDGKQTPSSDIYSVGATFYHLITGFAPPDCQKRVADLSSGLKDPYRPLVGGKRPFDQAFLASVDRALSIAQRDRFQSAREWIDALHGNPAHAAAPVSHFDTEEAAPVAPAPAPVAKPAAHTGPNSDGAPKHAPITSAPRPLTVPRPPKPAHAPVTRVAEPEPAPDPALDMAVEMELDPELVEAISTLVRDTSKDINPVDPVAKRSESASEQKSDKADVPLVDIFGQPIEDLDKWLKENDKERMKERRAQDEKNAEPEEADSEKERGGSVLARAFNKLTRGRKRAVATASQ